MKVNSDMVKTDEGRKAKVLFVTRYIFVGVTTPALYFLLFWFIDKTTELASWLASSLAYTLAVLYQFHMHSLYTFKVSPGLKYFVKFVVTIALGVLLSYILMELLPLWVENQAIVSAIVIVLVTPIFNFFLFSKWVFSRSYN